MSALPPITDVGRRIQISIWLSVYESTPYTAWISANLRCGDYVDIARVTGSIPALMGAVQGLSEQLSKGFEHDPDINVTSLWMPESERKIVLTRLPVDIFNLSPLGIWAGHGPPQSCDQSCDEMVGVGRFELPTPCSRSRCATRLRYTPAG
jgi:hypothetical protein